MKKKLASLFMTLILGVSAVAGCSLVERNDQLYYNATVATVTYDDGQTDKIIKRELITAYNSYGYQYEQNGSTKQEAVDKTIEALINKKITLKAVEDYYKSVSQDVLNGNETTYLWDQTYSSMFDNLKTYFDDIAGIKEDEDSEETDESTSFEKEAYLGYENVYAQDGSVTGQKLVVKKVSKATTIRETYAGRKNSEGKYINFETNQVDKDSLYNKLMSVAEGNDQSAKNWKSAINNYIADVKEIYDYQTFDSNKDVMMFEIDRVYKILKENYYSEKYTAIYNTEAHNGADNSNVTVADILNAYSLDVRQDYTKYVLEQGDFATDITSDGAKNYIAENGEYFALSYIMVDVDTDKLSSLKTQLDNKDIDVATYNAEVEKVYAAAGADSLLQKINTAIAKTTYLTVDDLNGDQIAEAAEREMNLQDYVAEYNKTISYEKAAEFKVYLDEYGTDKTKDVEYNPVFGIVNNEVVCGDTFKDNEDVANVIKGLYDGGDAQVGATASVRTDDGIYIFFYAGRVENLFGGIDEDFEITNENAVKVLASTRLNIFSEKTIFDKLYTELVSDNFSVFQNMNINYLRSLTEKIEIIENEIKDLY